ncbi:MAG: right-handed parallel beta-helix repeat-containing protein, partial [Dehalococcoidia bacterium]|nr:right-handed parallel beta-helix repeat-containing protein [Dehalococcoidia bacterium]
MKVTTPVLLDDATTDVAVKFLSTAGITNPTYGYSAWGFTTVKSRVGFIRTTDAAQDVVCDDDGYTIDESTATTLDFDFTASPTQVTGLSDKYTMINMYSSPLYLQAEDQYGNLCNTGSYITASVTLTSSSASGNFYYDANDTEDDGTGAMTLISSAIALSGGKRTIYYKDTVAGTYTLTASASGLTSATWTIQVCPAVSLYDRYDNLISSFSPPAATPVEESNDTTVSSVYQGGYYLDNAVDAAAAYDQVVLGDGYYEVDASTNAVWLDEAYMTMKSLNGADYTTIGSNEATISWCIRISAANVTVQDLTFEGDDDTDACDGIYVTGNAVTIQNNKFTGVPNDGVCLFPSGDITSGTITGNTFTGIGRGSAAYRNAIVVQEYGHAISKVTISNNTITGWGGYYSRGICVADASTGSVTQTTITGNTVTDCYFGLVYYGNVIGMTGDYATTGNTFSQCVAGVAIKYAGAAESVFNLVNNTITNNNLYGIYVPTAVTDLGSTSKDIRYNDLSGNGSFGLLNTCSTGTAPVARYNWWGDATGPSAGTGTYASLTARGSGDAVSTNVTYYEPWLHKTRAEVVADNASYQAAEMKLIAGWNTLSTPVQLDTSADTIDELIPSGMTVGYYYDGGWQQITTG